MFQGQTQSPSTPGGEIPLLNSGFPAASLLSWLPLALRPPVPARRDPPMMAFCKTLLSCVLRGSASGVSWGELPPPWPEFQLAASSRGGRSDVWLHWT